MCLSPRGLLLRKSILIPFISNFLNLDEYNIPVPVQKVREKRNRYTFAEQKPQEGYKYTHSLKIAFRLFELEWVY
jgi:hypothetical protein